MSATDKDLSNDVLALGSRNKVLDAIVDATTDGIISIDRERIIRGVNRAAESLFGYTESELLGQHINVIKPEVEKERGRSAKEFIGEEQATDNRALGLRKDGSTFPFALRIVIVETDGESLLIGIIKDLSREEGYAEQLKHTYAVLQESQNRLQAVIDTALDGIINVNLEGIITDTNPAAQELFQYAEGELLGSSIEMLMAPSGSEYYNGYLKTYLETGEGTIVGRDRMVYGRKKDGTLFPFRISISKLETQSGKIYTGIIHDITDQVKAEEELRKLNESLEIKVIDRTKKLDLAVLNLQQSIENLSAEVQRRTEAEQEIKRLLEKEKELSELKSRFVSMASHEFKTPLAGIISSASLIDKYPLEDDHPKRKKHVERIRSSVGNLNTILNEFLSLDKLQSGLTTLRLSQFEIQDLAEEVREDLSGILNEEQILSYAHHGESIPVRLDRTLVKNIMVNLISNAVKYAGNDLEIELHTRLSADSLIIEVADDGIGIPEAEQEFLFRRFFRANNATSISGTGLGLNIAQRHAGLMGGRIDFKSTEGVGTTFAVTLPTDLSTTSDTDTP